MASFSYCTGLIWLKLIVSVQVVKVGITEDFFSIGQCTRLDIYYINKFKPGETHSHWKIRSKEKQSVTFTSA